MLMGCAFVPVGSHRCRSQALFYDKHEGDVGFEGTFPGEGEWETGRGTGVFAGC